MHQWAVRRTPNDVRIVNRAPDLVLAPAGVICRGQMMEVIIMLRWTLIFLVVALVAAIFGFGGIAAGAADIARVLFFIFLVLFVLSLLINLFSGRNPPMGPTV